MRHGDAGRPRWIAAALVVVAVGATIGVGVRRRGRGESARCGPGFVARGARCLAAVADARGACPVPLVATALGCDAPDTRVLVPETTMVVGPSDWEAEGRVASRTLHVQAFRMDAFEVTRGRWGSAADGDAARAASAMTRDEAASFCARWSAGGRLPTEDEWIAAAVSGIEPAAPLSLGRHGRRLPPRGLGPCRGAMRPGSRRSRHGGRASGRRFGPRLPRSGWKRGGMGRRSGLARRPGARPRRRAWRRGEPGRAAWRAICASGLVWRSRPAPMTGG